MKKKQTSICLVCMLITIIVIIVVGWDPDFFKEIQITVTSNGNTFNDSDTINFDTFEGVVSSNNSREVEINITNNGSDPLVYKDDITLQIEGPDQDDFSIIDETVPQTLETGETGTLTILFAPQSRGIKFAHIIFEHHHNKYNIFTLYLCASISDKVNDSDGDGVPDSIDHSFDVTPDDNIVIGQDGKLYLCYNSMYGDTVTYKFTLPPTVRSISDGTLYIRMTNNDPKGYLRYCAFTINGNPTFSKAIGCFSVAPYNVRGFTAPYFEAGYENPDNGDQVDLIIHREIERTFMSMTSVPYPKVYPELGSNLVNLIEFINLNGEQNVVHVYVSHEDEGATTHGVGSQVSVRMVLDVEFY